MICIIINSTIIVAVFNTHAQNRTAHTHTHTLTDTYTRWQCTHQQTRRRNIPFDHARSKHFSYDREKYFSIFILFFLVFPLLFPANSLASSVRPWSIAVLSNAELQPMRQLSRNFFWKFRSMIFVRFSTYNFPAGIEGFSKLCVLLRSIAFDCVPLPNIFRRFPRSFGICVISKFVWCGRLMAHRMRPISTGSQARLDEGCNFLSVWINQISKNQFR